jgi:hypothetical protein
MIVYPLSLQMSQFIYHPILDAHEADSAPIIEFAAE